jgi:hypothetical protein
MERNDNRLLSPPQIDSIFIEYIYVGTIHMNVGEHIHAEMLMI